MLGPVQAPPEVPDIAVEVIRIAGGLDKREVHRGGCVLEVWFRQDGAPGVSMSRQALRITGPRAAACCPDPDPIVRFMSYPGRARAVRGLREALRSAP